MLSRLQDFEQRVVKHSEVLEITQNKLESSEQAHKELGYVVRRLQERGISALTDVKLFESADAHAATKGNEVSECTVRLTGFENRLDVLSAEVQRMQADQELDGHVATAVSSLKEIAPKVIAHESHLTQLQEDVSTNKNLCASRHKDMSVFVDSLKARIGRLEIDVERLEVDIECADGHRRTLIEPIPEEEEADNSPDSPLGCRMKQGASWTE